MAVATTCPNCMALFRLADEMAGKKVKCQKCQHIFIVPEPEQNTVAPGASVPSPGSAGMNMELDARPTSVQAAPPNLPPLEKTRDERNDDDAADEDRSRSRTKPPPLGRRGGSESSGSRRPRTKEAGSNAALWGVLIVLLGGGLISCIACAGLGGWWFVSVKDRPVIAPPPPVAKKDGVKDAKPFDANKDIGKQIPPFPQPQPNGGPIPLTLVPGTLRTDNVLTQFDELHQGKRKKFYTVQLTEGEFYQIDMVSSDFDSYLVLVNDLGQTRVEDDDGGGFPNARIVYRAERTGTYTIQATHFGGGGLLGNFSLFIRRAPNGIVEAPNPFKK
jgi:predicted Zn finger-like uncharacterized protein